MEIATTIGGRAEIAALGKSRVGRGQCIQHYGAGEAYLPILEALGRLGRDGGPQFVALDAPQSFPIPRRAAAIADE
jgi:hypothetical protein